MGLNMDDFLPALRAVAIPVMIGWAICAAALLHQAPAMAQSAAPGILEPERPGPAGEPTKIAIGVYVLDINGIDDARQEFSADVSVTAQWQDDRLEHGSADPRRAALNSVWHPRIVVFNARQVTRGLHEEVIVSKNGHVRYQQRFTGTFSAPLSLYDFPKDEQMLRLQVVFQGVEPNQLDLTVYEEATAQAASFTIADWRVEPGLLHIEPVVFSEAISRPGVTYQFKATRDVQYYRLKIISTLILIVLMSWSAFWIKIGDVGPKLAMGASSVLTLIAYRFYLSGLVPKISYMTRMDYFVMGGTVLVTATLIGTLLINNMHQNGHTETAHKVQIWSRFAFPAVLVILILILILER
jgi:hypothetical protein